MAEVLRKFCTDVYSVSVNASHVFNSSVHKLLCTVYTTLNLIFTARYLYWSISVLIILLMYIVVYFYRLVLVCCLTKDTSMSRWWSGALVLIPLWLSV